MQEENENAAAQPMTADENAAPEQFAQTTEEQPAQTTENGGAAATAATAAASTTETAAEAPPQSQPQPEETEDISYQAVQKDGQVTAIWEMQGRRHLRTIDPRSREGLEILRLFTAEHE